MQAFGLQQDAALVQQHIEHSLATDDMESQFGSLIQNAGLKPRPIAA